jgi:hypothetical protein
VLGLVSCIVSCVGAVRVLSKDRQGLGVWCGARIRCKGLVSYVGAVWVLSKDAKQGCQARDKVVRVYISSKRLVWWGAGFEIEF